MSKKPLSPVERRTSCLFLDFKKEQDFLRTLYSLSLLSGKSYKDIILEAVKKYAEGLDLHDRRG